MVDRCDFGIPTVIPNAHLVV